MLLKGKSAIVTGTNRGIGKSILEKFAKNGANVFAHSRSCSDEFEQYCEQLGEENQVKITPIYFDVRNEDEMKAAAQKAAGIEKQIDILVNNLGVTNSLKLFQMTSIKEMREEFEVNFFAQMQFTQYISRLMVRRKNGSIINISSWQGIDGDTGTLEYVSSKAAMIAATKKLAIELGAYNIRVNSVAPGLVDTDMGNQMKEEKMEEIFSKLIIKRKAKPEEIADAVLFLASDLSTFITGQVLRVDGGMFK